jgi:hypothetical protein
LAVNLLEPRSDLLVRYGDHFAVTTDAVTVSVPSQVTFRGVDGAAMSDLSPSLTPLRIIPS